MFCDVESFENQVYYLQTNHSLGISSSVNSLISLRRQPQQIAVTCRNLWLLTATHGCSPRLMVAHRDSWLLNATTVESRQATATCYNLPQPAAAARCMPQWFLKPTCVVWSASHNSHFWVLQKLLWFLAARLNITQWDQHAQQATPLKHQQHMVAPTTL